MGLVGVVSDFSGDNETIGTETMNLMVRTNVPFRIIEKSKLATAPLTGYKALISVDDTMPEPAARKKLLDFAQQGGALLVSQSWKGEGGTPTGVAHPRLDLRKLGKGKFAVCKDEIPDPYMVARDIHVLLGRINDLSRFFNLSAFLSAHTAPPGGASALLQITNFANAIALLGQPGDGVVPTAVPRGADVDPGFGGPGGTQAGAREHRDGRPNPIHLALRGRGSRLTETGLTGG